jgi:general secretion pathway protein D
MGRSVGALATALLLAACAPATLINAPAPGHLSTQDAGPAKATIPRPVTQAVPLPRPRSAEKTETYSVVVHNVKVEELLFALARDAKLNVDIHPGIAGTVSMNAIDQTLPQLLNRIAKQVDLRFELDGPNLVVMPDTPYLRNYKIDYVNMARDASGTVSTNTQISTSALAPGAAGTAAGGNTSRIQIDNRSRNRFWESLEKNLKDLLHETDKIFPEGSTETVLEQSTTQSTTGTGQTPAATPTRTSAPAQNLAASPNPATLQNSGATIVKRMTFREAASVIASPEAGIMTVRATSRQHEKVQEFIDRVMSSARRQVLIEATIVEVSLSDGYQQGIEWQRITDTHEYSITRPTITSNVPSALSPYVFKYSKINPLSLLTTVDLLRAFGTVKVLSSPKISVLNNQTATLKVSEDFVYFNVKSDTSSTANVGTTVGVTTTPQSVAVGFFMSLTAQIGDNDTVTLNVRPSISSISDLKRDPNPIIPREIPNFIPQIRTREIESLMRIESGDIAVLGGLMEDRVDNKNGRVPGLGDVPILGELFNTRVNSASKSELVILLRPTVIKDASINGDYASLSGLLPEADFFRPDKIYQPFAGPTQEALR